LGNVRVDPAFGKFNGLIALIKTQPLHTDCDVIKVQIFGAPRWFWLQSNAILGPRDP
jgi:hypothetical protein